MTAIYQANLLANNDLVSKHITLIASGAGKNARIICQQFQDNFVVLGGSGITIGLVLSMLLFAKSQRCKTLGKLALVPCFTGVQAPWTTPPIISGFIVANWQGAVLQIVIILISTAIYLPFFKIQDRQYAKEEQQAIETDNGVNA